MSKLIDCSSCKHAKKTKYPIFDFEIIVCEYVPDCITICYCEKYEKEEDKTRLLLEEE